MNQTITAVEDDIVDDALQNNAKHVLEIDKLVKGAVASTDAAAYADLCPPPWTLVAILCPNDTQYAVDRLIAFLRSEHGCTNATCIDSSVVTLAGSSKAATIAKSVTKSDQFAECLVALSLPFNSLAAIPQQYRLVAHCLATSEDSGVLDSRDKTLDFIKECILSSNSFDSLLHPALGILRNYDRVNQSNMLETLRVYLENDRNAQRCASILYLHRNSLQYRIRRIQEIAGINLNDASERTWLRLSFFMMS